MSLLERARRGLTELPSNAEWAVSQVRGSTRSVGTAAEGALSKARDQGRRFSEAAGDAVPFGDDSIELRLKRAEDAAERAREAEQEAVEAAQEAKDRSDYAVEVTERGRARMKQVDRDAQRELARRIGQAEREAEELVKRERLAAAEDAERERQEAYEEVEAETEPASATRRRQRSEPRPSCATLVTRCSRRSGWRRKPPKQRTPPLTRRNATRNSSREMRSSRFGRRKPR